MIDRARISRALLTVTVLLMLISLCGCAQFTDVLNETSGDEPVVSEPTPALAVSPTEAPQDETLNPVSVFYAEFDAQTHQQISRMEKALTSSGKAAQHLAKAALERANIFIRAAYVSVGRLTYDSFGIYNGSVMGAVSGSGTLQKQESSYIMRFSCQDGTSMYGVFTEKSIVYVMRNEGYSCCAIVKTDTGYRVVTDILGKGVVMEISGDSIAFGLLSFTQPVLELDASQSDAPDLAKYDPSYMNVDLSSADISSYWQLKEGELELIDKLAQQAVTPKP